MNPATRETTRSDNTMHPLARIFAQDEPFTLSLREYLEAHGCRVVLHDASQSDATYSIVCGDSRFVKECIASLDVSRGRVLVVIVNAAYDESLPTIDTGVKIVLLDPSAISPEDVKEIFSHFFSGKHQTLDKRRNRHVHPKNPVLPVAIEKQEVASPPSLVNEKPASKLQTYDDIFSTAYEKRIDSLMSDVFAPPAKKSRVGRKPKRTTVRVFWGLFMVVILWMLPAIWYLGGITATTAAYMLSAKSLKSMQVQRAQQWGLIGEYWLSQSSFAFSIVKTQWLLLGAHEGIRGQERLLSFFHDTRRVFAQIDEVRAVGTQVREGLLAKNGKGDSLIAAMSRLQVLVAAISGSLGLAQAQLETMQSAQSFPFGFSRVSDQATEVREVLMQLRVAFSYADRLLALYPKISGFDTPKTYLVLLQNSTELRPTGGFIGSIGKVTFDSGTLSDFVIQDVYAIDGQLKGHVDPPRPIAQLLAQEHWYLRDSNWDPDFRVSGSQAAWFYEKEAGEKVDGVIALSLPLVVDLLRITGPIVLSDYNEQISAENFFGKSLYYTKNNFFPGSTQKSDFLGTLARTLVLQLTTDARSQSWGLFEVLVTGIAKRDIMMWFPESATQQIAEHFGWAGAVLGRRGCEGIAQDACVFAPVAINEANVSVSKVNAFVTRHITRDIEIAQNGVLTEGTTVTLNNTAQSEDPGVAGAYKTYVRFSLPQDASVHEVTIDGVPVSSRPSGRQEISLPYIERTSAATGMQTIAVALEVPVLSSSSVRISYTRGVSLWGSGSDAVLDMFLHKQAGVGDMTQSIIVRFPAFWRVVDETKSVTVANPPLGVGTSSEARVLANEGQFEYNTTVLGDNSIRLRFFR
jgi:hypothetical protein